MHKAVIEAGEIQITPQQLIEFESVGRLLVIANAAQFESVLPRLVALEVYWLPLDDAEPAEEQSVTVIRKSLSALEGWLGAFKAHFGDLALSIDLVLDLGEQPAISTPVPPLGYFAPGEDRQALVEALQQLPELVGSFDKPKYFNYNDAICAHGRRGVKGCSNCIDACPAAAIESSGRDLINVNPSLCQGCGSCSVVCPSGAISYALPTLDVSIDRLRRMMQRYFELSAAAPQLLIHDENTALDLLAAHEFALPDHVIPFSIEEIAALGMPFWFTALAYGAAGVTVWDAGSHPDHDWQELQHAIAGANQMLAALGYGEQRIAFVAGNQFQLLKQHLLGAASTMTIERAQFAGIDDKRRMTTLALTHLHQQAPKPVAEMALATDAAFGEVVVDKQACTLCMSCVSVCPAGALLDGADKPQLNFIEDLCVQCGLCETACPENAISLNPRYLFEREQARQKRVLHEEAIFHCISCHKPFATQKMIDTMTAKLADHPMFQGEALQRLQMCEDCRVKAMFKDSQGPKQ